MIKDIDIWQEKIAGVKSLYNNLLEISLQQKDLLGQGNEESWDMEKLIELMNLRQEVIQRIEEMGPVTVPVHVKSNDCSSKDIQQSFSCEQFSQAEQISHIIQLIQTTDKTCQVKLEAGMQKISGKLSQTRENKKAQLAYDQGDIYTSAWFFDKKQ